MFLAFFEFPRTSSQHRKKRPRIEAFAYTLLCAECTAEDMGTCRFKVSDVHSIGILDIRTFNMDRNSDNLLVAEVN